MRKWFCMCLGLALALASWSPNPATASVVFFDNFDGENGGAESLNYNGFANWNVTDGTVDLIGNGGVFDFYPGNGLYVDLDGSTLDSGVFATNMSFGPGSYTLSFDLGGSARGSDETVVVKFGDYTESFTLASSDPLATITRTFTTAIAGSLSFEVLSNDNVGLILDNVQVQSVPEPASAVIIGSFVVAGFGFARRRLVKA